MVLHAGGVTGHAHPQVLVRLEASFLPQWPYSGANVSVVARSRDEGNWGETRTELTEEEVRAVLGLFEVAGFPDREPRVNGALDTTRVFNRLWIMVSDSDSRWQVDIHMQGSGFEGPDSPALRAALERLFALANHHEYDRSVFGDGDG
ncbi:MAG: hypothetical protein R3195_02205 [Gemmatimonadota bacterium]|nr:hypothetical protein [Gemmatimonadota bacterium]